MNRYAIIVFWSEADNGWIADAPDLRSCSAFGASPEDAIVELRVAMTAWLEAARAAGHPIPPANYQPHHAAAE